MHPIHHHFIHATGLKVCWSVGSHAVDLEQLSRFAATDDIKTKAPAALDELRQHRETSQVIGLVCEPWRKWKARECVKNK